MRVFDTHIVGIVSSVSAQKLKCPSSARLGLETFQLGLAQLGKSRLELITRLPTRQEVYNMVHDCFRINLKEKKYEVAVN